MNYPEFIEKAKKILKEDAGSEGLSYLVEYKGTLPESEDFTIENKEEGKAKITFNYPKDFGLALQCLKDQGVEVIKLELLF